MSFHKKGKKRRFWISFADSDSGRNLGVAIIFGRSPEEAIRRAWKLGVNPGGEVQTHALPEDAKIPADIYDRILTMDELAEYGVTRSPRFQA